MDFWALKMVKLFSFWPPLWGVRVLRWRARGPALEGHEPKGRVEVVGVLSPIVSRGAARTTKHLARLLKQKTHLSGGFPCCGCVSLWIDLDPEFPGFRSHQWGDRAGICLLRCPCFVKGNSWAPNLLEVQLRQHAMVMPEKGLDAANLWIHP